MYFELLESRQLLSSTTAHDYLKVLAADPKGPVDDGYTPAQIATAYGFDSLSNLSQRGAGQTIAIVDAFNDPKVAADLGVFDRQFGLPSPPVLSVVNQSGGSKLPTNNASWAGEIALDVEWAHAMAPAANILLVEARSDSRTNLLAAAAFAARAPGVGVVSMSWGFNESASDLKFDSTFLTPAGHSGVTFVAAGGDNGPASGAGWPAESPNVLSIGGTHLTLANDNSIQRETSWSSTGGGYSRFEPQPAYQNSAQDSGLRSAPDVAYDADPNTGFAVYDSIAFQGTTGWQEIAGDSAGAPQWAAIVAIANQKRAVSGLATLDGAHQVLPALYGLLSGGTTNSVAYTAAFNDISDTSAAGRSDGAATSGYDTATGLGTPKAAGVVDLLASADLDPSAAPKPLGITFSATSPLVITPGRGTTAYVYLSDVSRSLLSGTTEITLYASTDSTLDASDTVVRGTATFKVRLGATSRKKFSLRFLAPTGKPAGTYFLIASLSFTPLQPGGLASSANTFIGTSATDLVTTN